MCKDIDVLPRTLFNAKFIIWSRSAKEKTVQWLSVSPELWFEGLKARKECFAFSKETCWYGEKWPVVFDVDGKEGEPTVIQKAFHADPWLRLSRTGSKCGALGWEWPPANRATRKVSINKKISFYTEMSGYHRESSALCITENICLPLGDSSIEPQQLLVKSNTFLGWAFCKWCKMQSEYNVKGTVEWSTIPYLYNTIFLHIYSSCNLSNTFITLIINDALSNLKEEIFQTSYIYLSIDLMLCFLDLSACA